MIGKKGFWKRQKPFIFLFREKKKERGMIPRSRLPKRGSAFLLAIGAKTVEDYVFVRYPIAGFLL